MDLIKLAEVVTDDIITAIDGRYKEMEKRTGVYQVDAEYSNIWITRMAVLFESDGFRVIQMKEEKRFIVAE